jgi:hypothetical protein
MGDGYNFQRLREEILTLSKATNWEVARKEWNLIGVYEADEPKTCLCGHNPIREICEISNRLTGFEAEVGNRCVRRFIGLRSDLIFSAIKRIQADISKSLNAEAIVFFMKRGILTGWEYQFLQNTKNKRNLSDSQLSKRLDINKKILRLISSR